MNAALLLLLILLWLVANLPVASAEPWAIRPIPSQVTEKKISSVRDEEHGSTEAIRVARETTPSAKANPSPSPKTSYEKELAEARKMANELMETVRGLLMQEIQKGGFGEAVRVCSELAQEMTNRYAAQTGHYLRRVSLRYRNPKNNPDAYETRKLRELDRLNREKRLPEETFEVVEEAGVKSLRYLKPLTIAPLCVTCHGPKENIPAEVQAILKEKYPEDRATGFLVGDFRGAISVKIKLSEGKR